MTLNIVWSRKAQKDFRKIVRYISDVFGKYRSDQFVTDFEKFTEVLARFPYIGKQDGPHKEYRSFLY